MRRRERWGSKVPSVRGGRDWGLLIWGGFCCCLVYVLDIFVKVLFRCDLLGNLSTFWNRIVVFGHGLNHGARSAVRLASEHCISCPRGSS